MFCFQLNSLANLALEVLLISFFGFLSVEKERRVGKAGGTDGRSRDLSRFCASFRDRHGLPCGSSPL